MKPDAVLGVVIEDGDAVAISNFHDLAGEGVGSVRKPCQGDDRYCDHKAANISLTKSRRTRR